MSTCTVTCRGLVINALHIATQPCSCQPLNSFSFPAVSQTCLLNMTSSIPDHNKHLSSSNIIAVGTTGLIYAIDNHHVLKRCPQVSDPFIHQAFSIELRVYDRLGKHPRVATVYEVTEKNPSFLRGGSVFVRVSSVNLNLCRFHCIPSSNEQKRAAESLCYIHDKGIIQRRRGMPHSILTQGNHIKYIDFAGSGINNEPALVCYEWCSYRPDPTQHPDAAASIRTDIFALRQYPDLEGLMLGGCYWGVLGWEI